MLKIDIPGYGHMELHHIVLDYNGTLARDGRVLKGVKPRLRKLSETLAVHVVTADTFGRARKALAEVPCILSILSGDNQDRTKLAYVRLLGAASTVCIGNGRNDRLMLQHAALGIAVMQAEGAAVATMTVADVVTAGIIDALDLLLQPLRLVATLRS